MPNAPKPQAPTLGIDLDGTIDEAPIFFQLLTQFWPGRVVVITCRDDYGEAEADLRKHGIRFDDLVLAECLNAKARIIEDRGVAVYIDDQDECLQNIPANCTVLKIRNEGNFNFAAQKWLYSRRTGECV